VRPVLKPVLREWLEVQENRRKRLLDILLALLTIVSIVSHLVYLSDVLPPSLDEDLHTFEMIVVGIFAADYLARWHVSTDFLADIAAKGVLFAIRNRIAFMLRPLSLIDLFALMPALRVVRLARLFRLFRLLRLVRHTSSFGSIIEVFREHAFELASVFAFMLAILMVSGTAMFLVENPKDHPGTQFQSIEDAFWWAIVSMTTVGYGDKVPSTSIGRAIAGIVILSGVFAIAFPTAIITSAFMDKLARLKEGRLTMKRLAGHVVILGLTKSTDVIVRELEASSARQGAASDLVVVSSFATSNVPIPGNAILRRGDITRESTLKEAGIEQAQAVIILAERRTADTPDETIDARTILAAMNVDAMNRDALIVVELIESENVKTLRLRVPRAEIIESGALAPRLMAVGTMFRGTATVITDLLTTGENDFYDFHVTPEHIERFPNYGALVAPLRAKRAVPIAVRRGRTTFVNPEDSFALGPDDVVLVIGRETVVL
jgi:voltage-gated potassium channel